MRRQFMHQLGKNIRTVLRDLDPDVKVIGDWDLNFNLGSAVKYIARAGRKDDKIEDLAKAIQYLHFEIEAIKEGSNYDKTS